MYMSTRYFIPWRGFSLFHYWFVNKSFWDNISRVATKVLFRNQYFTFQSLQTKRKLGYKYFILISSKTLKIIIWSSISRISRRFCILSIRRMYFLLFIAVITDDVLAALNTIFLFFLKLYGICLLTLKRQRDVSQYKLHPFIKVFNLFFFQMLQKFSFADRLQSELRIFSNLLWLFSYNCHFPFHFFIKTGWLITESVVPGNGSQINTIGSYNKRIDWNASYWQSWLWGINSGKLWWKWFDGCWGDNGSGWLEHLKSEIF